ncbi:hypothetical protein SuNHUV7_15510 (plasmid) [Pseudoseohaeicola sp. NH-UV-7]
MVIIDLSANETKARAYSQQGHGKQHKPIQRPDTYQRLPEDMQLNTCEQQPVHTSGSVPSGKAHDTVQRIARATHCRAGLVARHTCHTKFPFLPFHTHHCECVPTHYVLILILL